MEGSTSNGSAAENPLDGLTQLQSMLQGARTATPEQRAAGPPPAMLEMMRMMAARRQDVLPGTSAAPAPSRAEATSVPVPAPAERDQVDVPATSPAPPDVQSVNAAPTESPRWRAQTTWTMDTGDGSGLRLVICEDDETEQAEIAEACLEGPSASQLTTLRPSHLAEGSTDPSAAAPPCDVMLEASPAAAIVRATAISTVGEIELFLTPPSTEQETFFTACNSKALSGNPGLDSSDVTEEEQCLPMQQRFIARCAVQRWCKSLRLRLLGPGSTAPSVRLGCVILRINPSAAPPPSLTRSGDTAASADVNGLPGDRLDMGKVEALIGDAVLSENSRKLFDSMKRQQESGGPGGSPAGAASLQGLAGMLSMMRPPVAGVRPSPIPTPTVPAGAAESLSAGATVPPPVQRPIGMASGVLAPAMAQIEAIMGAMESRLTSHVSAVEQRLSSRLDTIEAELGRIGRLDNLRKSDGDPPPLPS